MAPTPEPRKWGHEQPGKPESEVMRERGQLSLYEQGSTYDRWLTEQERKERT